MFLATTALTEFWKTDEPILFLGEWCLKYDHRHEWESLSYQVMEYPWDDSKRLSMAIEYCDSLYESVLECLVKYMNSVHGVEYGNRYWRIILGPWLLHYIHALYDRYIYLSTALDKFPELETMVLSKECYVTPFNYFDFSSRYTDDPYNLQLFSQILEVMGCSFPSKPLSRQVLANTLFSRGRKMRMFLKNSYGRLLNFLSSPSAILLFDMHFKQSDLWRLCLDTGFKAWPAMYDGKYKSGVENLQIRKDLRDKLRDFQIGAKNDEFKNILCKTLHANMPVCHLEGYELIRKFSHFYVKKKPIGIVSSFGWKSNERFKLIAAEAAEKGTKLLGAQHGASVSRYSAGENHVIDISDVYYTWGWIGKKAPQIMPLPDPSVQTLIDASKTTPYSQSDMPVLFAGTLFSRYQQHFRYCPLGPMVKKYIDWQIRFLQALPDTIRKDFIIRLYPNDYDWANKSRLSDQIPDLRFDDFSVTYQEQVKRSKLVVNDNLQMTFLEAMILNRPVILFHDPDLWKVLNETLPYIELLHEAGIFHYNPEDAAEKVSKIFENPGFWWLSEDVQAARKKYIDHFIALSDNWQDEWKKELLSHTRKEQADLRIFKQ